MASNPYFNFFNHVNEQDLQEDLTVEGIRQFAHDVYYLPRDINIKDKVMTEPIVQTYNHALPVEMYIKNWGGFEGAGQFLSKFGLEVRDQMTFALTKRSFKEFINPTTHHERPWEGDCIYIPMTNNVFQIMYVNSSIDFYVLGKNYAWEIQCELLEFNNEQFKTGVPAIDNLNPPFEHFDDPDYNLDDYDKTAQNTVIQDESDQIIDWTEKNPFGGV